MSYIQELDLSSNYILHVKLYRNVENVSEIRTKVMAQELECAVIKPSLIYDPFQITVAANKAVVADKTTTKSIYTEILFNLSISKNITQSLQKFGADDKQTDILVAFIVKKGESLAKLNAVCNSIKGQERSISEIHEISDLNSIKKIYKINEIETKNVDLLDSIVSRICTKDFVSVQ